MATPIKIQIKRSVTTSTPGTTLDISELAFSYDSNTLFIGGSGGVGSAAIPIGGEGTFALIDSPVFTGNPQAPTPSAANDSNSLATTSWVRDLSLSDLTGTTSADIDFNNNRKA